MARENPAVAAILDKYNKEAGATVLEIQ